MICSDCHTDADMHCDGCPTANSCCEPMTNGCVSSRKS
jgi:hypothetical protein